MCVEIQAIVQLNNRNRNKTTEPVERARKKRMNKRKLKQFSAEAATCLAMLNSKDKNSR